MKGRLFVMLLFVLAVQAGCQKSDLLSSQPTLSGTPLVYSYSGFDMNGVQVVSGTVILSQQNDVVTGKKDLTGSGPEAGTGGVSGEILKSGELIVYLTPQNSIPVTYIQANATSGTVTGFRLSGTGGPPTDKRIGSFIATPAGGG